METWKKWESQTSAEVLCSWLDLLEYGDKTWITVDHIRIRIIKLGVDVGRGRLHKARNKGVLLDFAICLRTIKSSYGIYFGQDEISRAYSHNYWQKLGTWIEIHQKKSNKPNLSRWTIWSLKTGNNTQRILQLKSTQRKGWGDEIFDNSIKHVFNSETKIDKVRFGKLA